MKYNIYHTAVVNGKKKNLQTQVDVKNKKEAEAIAERIGNVKGISKGFDYSKLKHGKK